MIEFESEQRQSDYHADELSIVHVIENLLDVPMHDPIATWIRANSIRSATTFALLTLDAIKTWTYQDLTEDHAHNAEREDKLLNCGQQFRVLRVIWYLNHLGIKGEPNRIMPYDAMNRTDFGTFCNMTEWHQIKNVPNSHGSPYEVADLHSFRAGIKFDIDLVPAYRDESHWERWSRILNSECASMHVDNVLNHDYTPKPGEIIMFNAHNHFVYEILERTILTHIGKDTVRKHSRKRDAQAAYRELCAHNDLRLEALSADKDVVFQYVSTAKLEHWHGKSYDFLQHWIKHLKMINILVATGKEHIPREDHTKLNFRLLNNTVSSFPELETLVAFGPVEKFASDGTPYLVSMNLTFSEYCDKLSSACRKLDRTYRPLTKNLHHYAYDFFDQHTDVRTTLSHMQVVHNNPHHIRAFDELSSLEYERLQGKESVAIWKGVDPENNVPHRHDYATDAELVRTDLYCAMEEHGSFIDRDGSRGVAGGDVRVVYLSNQSVEITKVMDRFIPGLEVCTVGAVATTITGERVILVMPEYVYAGTGKTVHSWAQLEHGLSRISCPIDGAAFLRNGTHTFPLRVVAGRPHLEMQPYTDTEWESGMQRVTLVSREDWHTNDTLDMVLKYADERDQHLAGRNANEGTQDCIVEDTMDFVMLDAQEMLVPKDMVPKRIPDPPGELTDTIMGSVAFPTGATNTAPCGTDDKHIAILTDERGVTSLESDWICDRDSSE